ncbi:MAG: alpha/beta fold hydrolase [Pirellulaceae bacterium]|nr:alpha/beta fold hydrolase [Pirellulaceae bacterium]
MMPSSVLRTLLLVLFSWGLLGAGIYFAYDAYHSFQQNSSQQAYQQVLVPAPVVADDGLRRDVRAPADQIVVVPTGESSWSRWGKVAAAVLCLGLCLGGRMPAKALMKSSQQKSVNADGSHEHLPHSTFEVIRPDGSRLHGAVFGNGQRPTLLLTHGWSLDSSAWNYMLASLTKQYRVVVWDLAGLGKSKGPKNNDYSLGKLADDLNAILERVSPTGPAILIGHSIGGMTQQTFCRLHGDKLGGTVKGLVMLQTTYTNPLSTNMLAGVVKPLEPLVSLINLMMIPLAPLLWLSNWQSYFNGSLHTAARLESFTGKQTWEQLDHSAKLGAKAWPGVVARGNFGMMKFNEEATLPNVNVPVLVVSGANDRLTLPSASKHIEGLLPQDTPHSHAGGHLGHWEYNDQVSNAILTFAQQVFTDTSNKSRAKDLLTDQLSV